LQILLALLTLVPVIALIAAVGVWVVRFASGKSRPDPLQFVTAGAAPRPEATLASRSLSMAMTAQAEAKAAEQAKEAEWILAHRHWRYFKSEVDRSFISVDIPNRKVELGAVYRTKVFDLDEVVSSEIIKQIPSFRGTANFDTVRTISLSVLVNDPVNPRYEIAFVKEAGSTSIRLGKGFIRLRDAEWFDAFLKRAIAERNRPAGPPLSDRAGAIERLWDLRQSGAMTTDAFIAEKARLLAGGRS